jgi:phage gp36-like protein
MSYATVAELQAVIGEPRLLQLTDLADPPVGLVHEPTAQRALDDASAEIDGYLVGRYALPLVAPVPDILRVHCCTLAHFRLLGDRAEEVMRETVKGVRAYLQSVAEGKVGLYPPSQAQPQAGIGGAIFSPGTKVMGRETA